MAYGATVIFVGASESVAYQNKVFAGGHKLSRPDICRETSCPGRRNGRVGTIPGSGATEWIGFLHRASKQEQILGNMVERSYADGSELR